MQIYLTISPEETQEAIPFQRPLAHAAYRIGEGSVLLSRALMQTCTRGGPPTRGGLPTRGRPPNQGGQTSQRTGSLLVLSDRAAPPVDRPEALSGAILRECVHREHSGVVLDFESAPREDLRRLAAALSRQCTTGNRTLFVPEPYANAAEHRVVIVNTAVSGGSFETHIREVCAHYGGPQNVALDIQRLRMEFRLPAPSGEGDPLSPEALTTLLKGHQPFFSRDLCARYFTCGDGSEGRFILFDDADTLRQKLRLGQQLGISAAFFQWPEIQDIADELFRRQK